MEKLSIFEVGWVLFFTRTVLVVYFNIWSEINFVKWIQKFWDRSFFLKFVLNAMLSILSFNPFANQFQFLSVSTGTYIFHNHYITSFQ